MPYKNPKDQKEYYERYISDPEKKARHDAQRRATSLEKYNRARQFVHSQKVGRACTKCGESDYRVLDFHHLDAATKVISISKAVLRRWDVSRIQAEIDKCMVLCVNCHRLTHWAEKVDKPATDKRTRRRQRIRQFVDECKLGKACTKCGKTDYRLLDFHHVDSETKTDGLANVSLLGWGKERILAEIAKCTILCANCHRICHHRESG